MTEILDYPREYAGTGYDRIKKMVNLYENNVSLIKKLDKYKRKYSDIEYLKKELKDVKKISGMSSDEYGVLLPAKIIYQILTG